MDSFKTKVDLITNFIGFPKEFSIESYTNVLLNDNFLMYFKNSILLTVIGTMGLRERRLTM